MRQPKRKSDESGVALLLAIFTLLLLTALGMALLGAADLETNIAANYRDKQVAHYAALSGLQEARDRLIPSRCVTAIGTACNDTIALDTRSATIPSTTNASVLYIINPANGETVAPWDPTNKYFDSELCHEHILGLTSVAGACPASTSSVPTGNNWYAVYNDNQTSAGGYHPVAGGALPKALPYKWVRVTVKTDNMTPALVQSPATGSLVCWNGVHQVPTTIGGQYDSACKAVQGIQLLYSGTLCGLTCTFPTLQGMNYSNTPTVTISGGGGSGATATAHVTITPTGQVSTITIDNRGSGYTSAPTVTLTGGGYTTPATAVATVGTGYPIQLNSGITPRTTNACYSSATPSVAIVGGGGTGATAQEQVTGGNNPSLTCISGWTLSIASGTCNESGTVTIADTSSGHGQAGSGLTGTITLNSTRNGIVSSSISNPGNGYDPGHAPTTFSGISGCTLSGTYTYGYEITDVALDTAGTGYLSAPTVTIAGPTSPAGGQPPLKTAALKTTGSNGIGEIATITVTNPGSGYATAPTVAFTGGGGTGAAATAVIGTTGKIDSVTLTNAGSGYTSNPTVTITDSTGTGAGNVVQAVPSYATSLGRVYLLTAMAVTPAGSKTMNQMEVATPVQHPLSMPGALTIDSPNPTINAGNSNNYFISGFDQNSCGQTTTAAKVSVGVIDSPNAPTNPTAVACVSSQLDGTQVDGCSATTSNPDHYVGSGASTPDVENVYNSLGDLSTPAGCDELATAIAAQATYTYGADPPCSSQTHCSIHLGTYPNDCPTTVVNGNLNLGPVTGCGVLLVTGNLTMSGNYHWDGPVFVIGSGGEFSGTGGGNGVIQGSLFVAKDKDSSGNLLASLGTPTISFDISGGGGNGLYYDHCKSDNMLSAIHLSFPPSNQPLKILSIRNVF